MVKLTAELIAASPQFVNAIGDREIDLRGNKIPVIENLGATLDQFDTIDLSDNEVRKVDGFPYLRRLKCILLNNNRVLRVAHNLEQNLPCLNTLILTNNNFQELSDLDPLASVKTLTTLSLLKNPVAARPNYRLYLISKLPQLHVLDFRRIRLKEREAAEQLFGKDGVHAKPANTFEPGEVPGRPSLQAPPPVPQAPPPSKDVEAIRMAIASASSLEEVQRLEALLKSGQVPTKELSKVSGGQAEEEEEEEMETDSVPNGVS